MIVSSLLPVAAALLVTGCPAGDCGGGIVEDEIAVDFRTGTTRERIDAMTAEIGASVIGCAYSPERIYCSMQLPANLGVDSATSFYASQLEVIRASPVLIHCPQ